MSEAVRTTAEDVVVSTGEAEMNASKRMVNLFFRRLNDVGLGNLCQDVCVNFLDGGDA